ncbi:hypothetical protein [Niveibacterium sp. SC-1]|uniref:hypothetical protein n=1 Tax=Niveibacterium sp. SC-1 TaxID=3135646 RepID=UPI00311FCB54
MKNITAVALRAGLLTVLLAGLAACASGLSAWRSDYTGPAFKKVMVIGVSNDPAQRKAFEDSLAAALRARGVVAFPTYQSLPDEGQIVIERVQKAVDANQADAVAVTRVKSITQEGAGAMTEMPGFPGWYSTAWSGVPAPGDTQTAVTVETTFWDAKSQKAIWRGTTKEIKGPDVQASIQDLANQIAATLKSNGFI